MKNLNKIIIVIEVLLIVLMSIIAAYGLFGGTSALCCWRLFNPSRRPHHRLEKTGIPGIFSGVALIAVLPAFSGITALI